jgi:hypothetical protein
MSVEVFSYRSAHSIRRAQAVADACNELQRYLVDNGRSGTIIGYEVEKPTGVGASFGDTVVDVIYAERDLV